MYVCTYVRMYACTYVRMYVCTYVLMHVCAYVRMYACTHVRMYVCTFVRMYVCTFVYFCTYGHMYLCTYVRTYVCKCMYILRKTKHIYNIYFVVNVLSFHRSSIIASAALSAKPSAQASPRAGARVAKPRRFHKQPCLSDPNIWRFPKSRVPHDTPKPPSHQIFVGTVHSKPSSYWGTHMT